MPFERILVVDDQLAIRKTMEEGLRWKRHSVVTAESTLEAEKILARDKIDLMFLDIQMPDGDGMELLERLSKMPERPLTIMMSGFGTIETAVSCMRFGAFDYLIKPFSMAKVEELLKKADLFNQVLKANREISNDLSKGIHLIGKSQTMVNLKMLISKVAPTDATVLICGENGTGKELVANDIHQFSSRAEKPFIKINCAAVSETLIESEFFGHEKGAYTGATERREGRFELANGGTLLLDEISEIPPHLQAKLLRVLQEREFERVGGSKTIKVDVRVLATTNRDLKKAVENGEFREDLYYRLNVFPLNVPPLRERGDDIQLLAETFLQRSCQRYGQENAGFATHTVESMLHYRWPGNVRELQNCIERSVIISNRDTPIKWEHLGLGSSDFFALPSSQPQQSAAEIMPVSEITAPHIFTQAREAASSFPSLEELEKEHILRALEVTNGNRTHAASLLKISIRTLRNKLNDYKLGEASNEGELTEQQDCVSL